MVDSCKTVEVFKNKWIEQDAMLRNFEIIGEAANHISEEIKQKYPTIEWYKIRGMRNFVSHEYFSARLETVWDTAIFDIPILMGKINEIILDIETK